MVTLSRALLTGIAARTVAVDKTYDCDALIDTITTAGAEGSSPAYRPHQAAPLRPRSLQGKQFGRVAVLSDQTLPQDLHQIRQAGPAL